MGTQTSFLVGVISKKLVMTSHLYLPTTITSPYPSKGEVGGETAFRESCGCDYPGNANQSGGEGPQAAGLNTQPYT